MGEPAGGELADGGAAGGDGDEAAVSLGDFGVGEPGEGVALGGEAGLVALSPVWLAVSDNVAGAAAGGLVPLDLGVSGGFVALPGHGAPSLRGQLPVGMRG